MTNESHTFRIGDTEVELRNPVDDTTRMDGVVVVLLDVPTDEVDNRNVLGFSTDGERLWEIEPIDSGPSDDAPYNNLTVRDGSVWVFNWAGYECRVDLETGELLEKNCTR